MTARTDSFPREAKGRDGLKCLNVRGGVVLTIYAGDPIAHRAGAEVVEVPDPANPRTDLIFDGWAKHEVQITSTSVDANGGLWAVDVDGNPITVNVESGIGCGLDTGTSTNAITMLHRGLPAYFYDNNTVYLTSNGGTLSPGGTVALVNSDGTVDIDIADEPWVYAVFGETAGTPGVTSSDDVLYVATSLPAGAFSNGVWTATVVGAFSTAQDGVAIAVGQKFILQEGTITTLVVSAANAGEYVWTSLGGASASATFARTSNYEHGAVITSSTRLKVAQGTLWVGTTWSTLPATAALLVGTGDAALRPDRVVRSVSLGGGSPLGTVTISDIPLRATGVSGIAITRTAAVTSTLTVGGYATTTFTGGPVGTSSIVIIAAVGAGTINTADGSTLRVTVTN